MKKIILSLTIILTCITSCETDSPKPNLPEGLIFSTDSPYEILSSVSQNEIDFTKTFTDFGYYFKSIIFDTELKYDLIKEIKKSAEKDVIYTKLIENNVEYLNISKAMLAKNNGAFILKSTSNIELLEKSIATLSSDGIQYYPNVYIPNIDIADFSKPSIIAIGSDFESEKDEYEDMIPGWIYYSEENYQFVLISEEFAMNTEHPIYIINNKSEGINDSITTKIINKKVLSEKTALTSNPYITNYKISKRYDNSRRSEYSYTIGYYYSNGGNQGGDGNRTEIREIKKKNINNLYTDEFHIFQLDYVDAAGIWFATFEYDWYASKKDIFISDDRVGLWVVQGRMSKDNEYYQKFYFDLSESSYTQYSKGQIEIVN